MSAIHAKFRAVAGLACSPSFNWKRTSVAATIAKFSVDSALGF